MTCGSWCLKVFAAVCMKALPSSRFIVALGHLALTTFITVCLFIVSPDLNASVSASIHSTYSQTSGSTILSAGNYKAPPSSSSIFSTSPIAFSWAKVVAFLTILTVTNFFYLLANQLDPGYLPKNYRKAVILDSVSNEPSDAEAVALFVGQSLSETALRDSTNITMPASSTTEPTDPVPDPVPANENRRSSSTVPKVKCDICNIEELPLRARHCIDCNRCVRRYDHHCPWVGNCVGEGNHKFFLSFLLLQIIVIYWVLIMIWRSFVPSHLASDFLVKNWLSVLAFGIVAITALPTSCLTCLHLYLACTNSTTWEMGSRDRITYLRRLDQILPAYLAGSSSPFHSGYCCNLIKFCCSFRPIDWEPIYQRNIERARRMWDNNKDSVNALFQGASNTSRWSQNRFRQASQSDSDAGNQLLPPRGQTDTPSEASSSEENQLIFARDGRI